MSGDEGPLAAARRTDQLVDVTPAAVRAAASTPEHGAVVSKSPAVRRRVRGRAAQLPVPHQHRHRDPPGRGHGRVAGQLQGLVLRLALALVPPVLEPDLHLRGGELQDAGQVLSLRRRQVALPPEVRLQLGHLGLREEDPGLPARPGPALRAPVALG